MVLQKERVTYSYREFRDLTEDLLAQNKTTGTNHSADYIHYTRMNLQRMDRIYKNTTVQPELAAVVQGLEGRYKWIVLVEAWCGDVPQNLPVMAKIAELNPNIELVTVLRDENLDLMDQHLTNGGRGIPKLVIVDKDTQEAVAEWGPRPAPAQQMVYDWKAAEDKKPYMEFVVELQKWYAKDRTATMQKEFTALLATLR